MNDTNFPIRSFRGASRANLLTMPDLGYVRPLAMRDLLAREDSREPWRPYR